MSALETIKAKISEINAKREELISELRKDFSPMLKPLFEKSNGKIKSISWAQYTPYFNDGDSCEFGVNLDYGFRINGIEVDEHENLNESEYVRITEENIEEVKSYVKEKGYTWMQNHGVGESGYIKNKKFDQDLYSVVTEIKSALSEIDDDFYKELFGDHVLVTVNVDGTIETEEYEHD